MPPFLISAGAKLLGVGDFLKKMPWQVWAVAGLILLYGLGSCQHKKAVKKFGDERYTAGYTKAKQEDAAKAATIAKNAGEVTRKAKELFDAANRITAGRADALRVQGPGRAVCFSGPAISARAGGREGAPANPDAGRSQVPAGDWAAVPWPWLVDRGERCDVLLNEVKTWRDWHQKQTVTWGQ